MEIIELVEKWKTDIAEIKNKKEKSNIQYILGYTELLEDSIRKIENKYSLNSLIEYVKNKPKIIKNSTMENIHYGEGLIAASKVILKDVNNFLNLSYKKLDGIKYKWDFQVNKRFEEDEILSHYLKGYISTYKKALNLYVFSSEKSLPLGGDMNELIF